MSKIQRIFLASIVAVFSIFVGATPTWAQDLELEDKNSSTVQESGPSEVALAPFASHSPEALALLTELRSSLATGANDESLALQELTGAKLARWVHSHRLDELPKNPQALVLMATAKPEAELSPGDLLIKDSALALVVDKVQAGFVNSQGVLQLNNLEALLQDGYKAASL